MIIATLLSQNPVGARLLHKTTKAPRNDTIKVIDPVKGTLTPWPLAVVWAFL